MPSTSPDTDLPVQNAAAQLLTEAGNLFSDAQNEPTDHHPTWLTANLDTLVDRILTFRQLAQSPPVYYDDPQKETLYHTQVDDAVADILDSQFETREDYPEYLSVAAFTRMIPASGHYKYPSPFSPLQELLQWLDEEYSDPEDPDTDSTPQMKDAESRFVQAVLLGYRSYWCEVTTTTRIRVRTWLHQHRPHDMPILSFNKAICAHCHRIRGAQEMRTCSACSRRCWRGAQASASPWPRSPMHNIRTCAFRLSDKAENQKVLRAKEFDELFTGWGFRSGGPVDAE